MRVALCRLPGALALFVSLRVSFPSSQGAVMRAAALALPSAFIPRLPVHSLPLFIPAFPLRSSLIRPLTWDEGTPLGQMDLIPVQNIMCFGLHFSQ